MPRPRTYDENLRQKLLEAAASTIVSQGEQSMSLRVLAAEAGTTTSAVYSLFGDKEALVVAVAKEGFRRFAQALEKVPRTEDPWGDLLTLGVAYREYALAEPHFYRVMFSRPRHEEAPGENNTFGALLNAVQRATGLDSETAQPEALRLWALAHGLVSLELNGLIPGSAAERKQGYIAALRTST
ncbi:TetR/AcrR family transcriptional regulator [Nesterenkonia ebinurensis]|uniref:TetR/AcrR family transcriptional regulator n=1 Tax=Nesterenkonia ebinurensis TaxID=2608252 RepID=UPI00123CA1EC|nr:TetR/AcrR family transcriptional regulator [Nesterenkonia ebinurensis]